VNLSTGTIAPLTPLDLLVQQFLWFLECAVQINQRQFFSLGRIALLRRGFFQLKFLDSFASSMANFLPERFHTFDSTLVEIVADGKACANGQSDHR